MSPIGTLSNKPKLIVHAGIPKCATSSLQMLMSRDDFYVSRKLGVVWLGKGLQPFTPGVVVADMMYHAEHVIGAIETLKVDPDTTYFISSEALSGKMAVWEALAQKFEITRIVLSIRLPILMALSAYCFSGWLSQAPEQVPFAKRHDQILQAIERISKYGHVVLCPIEPSSLATRFCQAISGKVIEGVEEAGSKTGRANESVPPALAIKMHQVMIEEGIGSITGPMHSEFTKVAKNNPGRPRFRDILPEPFSRIFRDIAFCEAEVQKYAELLRYMGVSESVADTTVIQCQSQLDVLRTKKVEDPEMDDFLLYRARWNLARVQKVCPAALPTTVADLRHYLVPIEHALPKHFGK